MLLALIHASLAAEHRSGAYVDGTPEGFVATNAHGAVLSTPEFMRRVGDRQGLQAYDLAMTQARRRSQISFVLGPLIAAPGAIAVVYGYSSYEPAVMAVGSAALFGGPILSTVGGMRFALQAQELHQIDAWYTYEQAVAWSDGVAQPGPDVDAPAADRDVSPVYVTLDPRLAAYSDGVELGPADFAWQVGARDTWAMARLRGGINGVGGGVLVVGGLGALALSSVADSDVAAIPGSLGVVGVVAGGALLTVGRRRFRELDAWYEPADAQAWAVTPGVDPT